tara:strand:- start:1444 stop:1635 length:192 start_codon:yes stop_codon:yes gene_type:complete
MGKGSGRRPTDQQKFEDNFDKIFRMKQQEEWREEIINERHEESLKDKDNGNKPNAENAEKIKG